MQAASRARFDAGRFEAHQDAVIAQRAFENFARRRTEFRNVEGAASHAITATDAIRLLEIDDAVRILDDGGVRRARGEAAWAFAMHALGFAHELHHAAVFALMFVKLD